MRFPFASIMLLVAVMASPLRGVEVSPFETFQGNYLTNGVVKIFQGNDAVRPGVAKLRFQIGSTGRRARLKFNATIKLPGEDRSFSGAFLFKRRRNAQISNLAPGIDDGHPSDGTYAISHRRITAKFPVVVGTTTGEVTLLIRLEKHATGNQLLVIQTLSTSTLDHPIIWKFSARSPL